ncbi:hypothetical protein JCGZ_17823 [Jatropha curcas]|uniref:DUF7870 domain-containing protein n=2 Tax=Jatropha curcas TaxID=180498 RepID=A0A067K343_JATCU|nr:hypothetical protein JCGZ_17823 [Jatropha curcas]
MEFAHGGRTKEHSKMKQSQNGDYELNSVTLLVIKLSDLRVLHIVSRSLFLVVVILTLPWIGSILKQFSSTAYYDDLSADDFVSDIIDVEFLDSLLIDLANEGLIKKGNKALFVCSGIGAIIDDSRFLNANEIDFVLGSNLGQHVLLHDASFDFVFAFGYEDVESLDSIVKVGGILVAQLSDFPNDIQKQFNYKVVYLRQYRSTIVAMRKTSLTSKLAGSSAKRKLFEMESEAKKDALNGLEDVLLEPPRKVFAKSTKSMSKFNYFPDLLGDSLEDYPRRVFVDVSLHEQKNVVKAWFSENYPTRNQKFETYNIEMVSEGVSKMVSPGIDVSNWLMKNVKEDEFVVMKAEAEVVEEMMQRRTINLVDELFLECQNQWEGKKSKRAYWECLALYGRLRDKGIAVHQWWG